MTTWTRFLMGGAATLALLAAAPAFAQDAAPATPPGPSSDDQPPAEKARDTVVIYGRATEQIGEAQTASEGVVGYADFETRPLLRPGELVEVIPGMVAAQHSGGGKANQYFLRGFNLDHGTD